ncbi:hypothetical protein BB558_006917 [Smittium angustum]|uniref:Uncharacterized protein n=1 Tax=Smittium angustum TaxID=133377 RepID=A0A2U1IWF9_SMIAN|nr:hypothetical protein BB558_006917 [Smittium angustum]
MPNSKGSKNNFSQRESDPSIQIDRHEEAKVRLKEHASEMTQHVEYWENDFIKRYGIEKFNKPITNRFLEAARKAEKPKSALMNLVHTIPDEGIDDDAISKLMIGRSTVYSSDKETMTTRVGDINKTNNEINQKKVLFADTVKKNIKTGDTKKISQKTVPRKSIVFTKDQMLKVINGQSPFELSKYKLVYFEGIQRCRVAWANQLLLQSGIKAYQLGNVDWVTDTKLEVCINKKEALQLVKRMDTIKGVTYYSIYNPIAAKKGKQSGLDQLKARLKWQISDANRNKPAQRMARLITKMTEMNTDGFSYMFLYTHQPETAEIQMDATGTNSTIPGTPWFQKTTSITIFNSRMNFAGNKVGNANNTNTGAGLSDKLIIWNAPELKAKKIEKT